MKRRQFLESLCGSLAVLGPLSGPGPDGPFAVGDSRRLRNWTWVNGRREASLEGWLRLFSRVQAAGITGVLVSGSSELPARAAHDLGLEFQRWIWTLNRNGDAWVRENHPEWFTVSRDGKSSLEHPPYVDYYRWLCPTRASVRDYLKSEVSQIASAPDVDGVHLDYVRHCDVILPVGLWTKYNLVQDREYPEFDFCYCDVCRAVFREQTGRDPLESLDPTADAEWREFRWNGVTALVRALTDAVHARGKQISAAVFPTPTVARRLVRQAWDEWPVDAFFPMIYHSFYNEPVQWIGEATAEGVAALPAAKPLFSGLYLPQLTPEELGTAVGLARGAGAAGVSLFEVGGLSDDRLRSLRESLHG